MDSAKAIASGVSSSYHVEPITGNSPMASPVMSSSSDRKKHGRSSKYKPDESKSRAFSSFPSSSSAPPATGQSYVDEKNQFLERPTNSVKKHRNKVGAERLDDMVGCFTGSSFLPHVITVNAGEDISTKIMEFSLRGPRSVCVISGSGTVSSVIIRHPTSAGGIFTLEGLFEILTFTGSFNPVEMEQSKYGRSGMMSMSLSDADNRVVGGVIAGRTIAASLVKVVVASFLLGSQHLPKPKKQKTETKLAVDALDHPNGAPAVNMQGSICSTSDSQH